MNPRTKINPNGAGRKPRFLPDGTLRAIEARVAEHDARLALQHEQHQQEAGRCREEFYAALDARRTVKKREPYQRGQCTERDVDAYWAAVRRIREVRTVEWWEKFRPDREKP